MRRWGSITRRRGPSISRVRGRSSIGSWRWVMSRRRGSVLSSMRWRGSMWRIHRWRVWTLGWVVIVRIVSWSCKSSILRPIAVWGRRGCSAWRWPSSTVLLCCWIIECSVFAVAVVRVFRVISANFRLLTYTNTFYSTRKVQIISKLNSFPSQYDLYGPSQ